MDQVLQAQTRNSVLISSGMALLCHSRYQSTYLMTVCKVTPLLMDSRMSPLQCNTFKVLEIAASQSPCVVRACQVLLHTAKVDSSIVYRARTSVAAEQASRTPSSA